MKKLSYKELSDKTCTNCGKLLKQNLVNRRPDATFCYKCDQYYVKHNPRYKLENGKVIINKNFVPSQKKSDAL